MPVVFVPRRLRPLTGGLAQVEVAGRSVRQTIDALEVKFPGIRAKLYDAERDALVRGLAVCIDGVSSELGLLESVGDQTEIHFLSAIAGGG